MRKNGSRLISLKQYRLTDLFLFAAILAIFDLLAHYVPILFGSNATFVFTLTVPITLLVMMRWGWPCVFFAVGDGILLALLNNPSLWQGYVSYGIGFGVITLLVIPLNLIGKQKIAGKWYLSALFVILAWGLMNVSVSLLQAACGYNVAEAFATNFGVGTNGLVSLGAALIVILVMRRLDGMFEDQRHYLIRQDKERRELARRDEFGDEPIEIDEETMSILNRRDDGLGE